VAACSSPKYIPGTQIPATRANREIIEVMEAYRHSLITMDVEAFIKLIHPKYHQPQTSADSSAYNYDELVKAARLRFSQLHSVRLEIQYRRIQWEAPERVSVEVYLDGSFQLEAGEETRWEKKTDYMRLTLEKSKITGHRRIECKAPMGTAIGMQRNPNW
jgi:hypothetical protein